MRKERKEHKDGAISLYRPWIRIYQEMKWLNAFAITNDLALQKVLKAFNSTVFIEGGSNLLAKNIKSIFEATEMAQNSFITQMHNDITDAFAHLYTKGNKEEARKILDAQQEITQE